MDRCTEDTINAIIRERKEAHAFYTEHSEVYRRFLGMEGAAFSTEGVGKAQKELIAVGISIVIHCEPCLQWHIREAMGAGASADDVLDAIGVGIEMGGGPATVSARFAMDVLAYYTEHARIQEISGTKGFDECAQVIRRSFSTVADEYGLTASDCPGHPAFLETDKLLQMRQDGVSLLGLTVAGRLAGCVGVKAADKLCCIEKLSVLPGFRRRGLGKRLMEAAMACARERGCEKASVGIIDDNRILKDWYIGQGFCIGEVKTYGHLPFAVCMMEKDLS